MIYLNFNKIIDKYIDIRSILIRKFFFFISRSNQMFSSCRSTVTSSTVFKWSWWKTICEKFGFWPMSSFDRRETIYEFVFYLILPRGQFERENIHKCPTPFLFVLGSFNRRLCVDKQSSRVSADGFFFEVCTVLLICEPVERNFRKNKFLNFNLIFRP